MAQRTKVTTVDRGYNRLIKRAKRLPEGQVTIGIHPRDGQKKYLSGVTVSEVARLHESGTSRMPARPFLTHWWTIQGGQRRIRDATREALNQALRTGRDPRKRLEAAGARYQVQIRETFRRMKPIAPSTARAKGSTQILIDSGLLWRSIGFRVTFKRRVTGS